MRYFELRCMAFLKSDIKFENSFDSLSKYINYSMSQDNELKELHNKEKIFKAYCFAGFYPVERDKLYKKGKNYSFTIRSLDENFIDKLATLLRENINNPNLQVLQTTKKRVNKFFINEIYSITPTIMTTKDENNKSIFWTVDRDGDVLKLQKQLQDNLEKKYESFYGEKIEANQNFIQLLEIKNQKPQSIFFTKSTNDKKQRVRLFGNKFRIVLKEDEISQKLGFVALACGLGEKQSYGGGVCLWG